MNFFRYNRIIDCVWLCNCRAACGTRKTGLRKDGGKNMTGICFDIDDTLYSRRALLIQAAEETLRRTDGFIMSERTSFSGEVFLKIFYEKSDENFALVESGAITARESNIWRLQQTFLTMGLPTESWQGAYFTDRYTQLQNQIALSPIMRKLLEDLARCAGKTAGQLRLGIVTNGASGHQWKKYRQLGLEHYIPQAHVTVSGDVGISKPEPGIFRAAEDAIGLPPGDLWLVGDSLKHDIEGAHAAGWHTIWMNRNAGSLQCADADITVRSEAELAAALRRLVQFDEPGS